MMSWRLWASMSLLATSVVILGGACSSTGDDPATAPAAQADEAMPLPLPPVALPPVGLPPVALPPPPLEIGGELREACRHECKEHFERCVARAEDYRGHHEREEHLRHCSIEREACIAECEQR